MGDWIAFWDSEHSIYVNARHRDVHYRTIAQDIRAALPAVPTRRVQPMARSRALRERLLTSSRSPVPVRTSSSSAHCSNGFGR